MSLRCRVWGLGLGFLWFKIFWCLVCVFLVCVCRVWCLQGVGFGVWGCDFFVEFFLWFNFLIFGFCL